MTALPPCPCCRGALYDEMTLRRPARRICISCGWGMVKATPATILPLLRLLARAVARASGDLARERELATCLSLLLADAAGFFAPSAPVIRGDG